MGSLAPVYPPPIMSIKEEEPSIVIKNNVQGRAVRTQDLDDVPCNQIVPDHNLRFKIKSPGPNGKN